MSSVKKWRKMLVTSVRRRKNSDVIDLALCRLSGRASERGWKLLKSCTKGGKTALQLTLNFAISCR